MSERHCQESDCDKGHYARGFCWQHYRDALASGDLKPNAKTGRPRKKVENDGVAWSEKPSRTRAEVSELMVKRAYQILDDPESTKDAVLKVLAIAARWEQKTEDPQILDELKKLQGEVRGIA